MKMALGHNKLVKPTTERDTPRKHSVQATESKMGKKLSELLRGVEAKIPSAAERLEIQQVTCDSRKVEKARRFFGLNGGQLAGIRLSKARLDRGAWAMAG